MVGRSPSFQSRPRQRSHRPLRDRWQLAGAAVGAASPRSRSTWSRTATVRPFPGRAVRTTTPPGSCAARRTRARPQCFAASCRRTSARRATTSARSVLDLQQLVAVAQGVRHGGCTDCGRAPGRPDAHRLRRHLARRHHRAATAVATKPDIKAAVLNVPGVGWVDILENTQTLAIRCSLVDGLIDAGILTGDKLEPGRDAHRPLHHATRGRRSRATAQFSAIGRWVLDPADPANFVSALATRAQILIQEVVGDTVVPNIATDRRGRADRSHGCAGDAGAPAPRTGVDAGDPGADAASKFVTYTTSPPNRRARASSGNTFDARFAAEPGVRRRHATLRRPEGCDARHRSSATAYSARARMAVDAHHLPHHQPLASRTP